MSDSSVYSIFNIRLALCLILFFLAHNFPAHARVGLSEISFFTPGGHTICDCDPYKKNPVLIGYENNINLLEKWYFYNNHIVGKGENYYFIFNEATRELRRYSQKQAWESAIGKQRLEPRYTRWLSIDDAPEAFYLIIFLSSFVIVPLLMIVLFVIVGLTHVKVIVWNRKAYGITIGLCLVTIISVAYRLNVHSF